MSELGARIARVRNAITAAAARSGRDARDVELIAVSKRHPIEAIRDALAAGHHHFGENFAQELQGKRDALAGETVRWHFIGTLQRNKVKLVIGVELIHAVDSLKLAEEIARRAEAAGVCQRILLAVNAAGEDSKSGVSLAETPALLERVHALAAVRCDGFMTMPPLVDDAELNRPHFRAVAALRDRLATLARPLPALSMGTTGDYEVAVEEGATLVRVGTAIFGPRTYTEPA